MTDKVTDNDTAKIVCAASKSELIEPLGTWQPIETAPKDGTPILGVQFCKYPSGELYPDGAVMMWEGGSIFKGQWAYMGITVIMVAEEYLPTHWMPLPALPEST